MKCNCVKEIEEKIKEAHPTWNGKKVVSVKIPVVYVFSEPVTTRTQTNVEIEVENQKKKYEVGLNHTFCPFCGIKQSEE
jgi:copper chaperone CopZ